MKRLFFLAPLVLISQTAYADPLRWENVPVPSFGYSPPAPTQQGDSYGSTSYVRGPNGQSSVTRLNENTYRIRDANGVTRICTVLSSNQVRCN